jgi:2-polyprenyl-6-methoxyphenol hydroxylase-like FAD-dependent oxidoreductase
VPGIARSELAKELSDKDLGIAWPAHLFMVWQQHRAVGRETRVCSALRVRSQCTSYLIESSASRASHSTAAWIMLRRCARRVRLFLTWIGHQTARGDIRSLTILSSSTNSPRTDTMNTPRSILISGAGIAGPALAYWLSRVPNSGGLDVTIVERSASPRTSGQAVDLRGPGVKVLQRMGLEAEVRRRHTNEKGTCCGCHHAPLAQYSHAPAGVEKVNTNGKVSTFQYVRHTRVRSLTLPQLLWAISSTGNVEKQAFSSEFEILRGDLARLFIDAASQRPNVKIVYGEHVSTMSQPTDGPGPVHVEFANGKLPAGNYDLVVAADGLLSRTRSLATGRPARSDAHPLGDFSIAYCTIRRTPGDSPSNARCYSAPGRVIMLRPSPAGIGALLMFRRAAGDEFDGATETVDIQKQYVASIFAGAGWETPRVLEGMMAADDFYFERLIQVKCPQWSFGRVALLGDAGFCPSPFSGMGTTLALYGAYVLAGEISLALRDGRDLSDALVRYDAVARPYIDRVQDYPVRVAQLFMPKTRVGVWILDVIATLCYWTGVMQLFAGNHGGENEKEPLPTYDWVD